MSTNDYKSNQRNARAKVSLFLLIIIFFKKKSGMKTPMCTVNGAQFLSDNGWLYLRNTFDINVPFQLFRDEGRTFLQVRRHHKL